MHFPCFLASGAISDTLPHKGSAILIDAAELKEPSSATGYFRVRADDVRILDHMGCMRGSDIAEFAHLTGAVLLCAQDTNVVPMLTFSTFPLMNCAVPGDQLTCECTVKETTHAKPPFGKARITCFATIRNQWGETVAEVEFKAVCLSRKAFEFLLRAARNKSKALVAA